MLAVQRRHVESGRVAAMFQISVFFHVRNFVSNLVKEISFLVCFLINNIAESNDTEVKLRFVVCIL